MKAGYDLVIPGEVYHDAQLSVQEKLLYGEIRSLCRAEGFCWASNRHFAGRFDVSERTIQRWLLRLAERGYLIVDIKRHYIRKIQLLPSDKNQHPPTRMSHPPDTDVAPPRHECRALKQTQNQSNIIGIDIIEKNKMHLSLELGLKIDGILAEAFKPFNAVEQKTFRRLSRYLAEYGASRNGKFMDELAEMIDLAKQDHINKPKAMFVKLCKQRTGYKATRRALT